MDAEPEKKSMLEQFLELEGAADAVPEGILNLHRAGKIKQARKLLLDHVKTEPRPDRKRIQEVVLRELRYWVRPAKAPTMYTINGIGTAFYGKYQKGADELFIGTLWLVFVFIPVFPISAYLAMKGGDGYYFFGKTPLPPAARVMRGAVFSGLLVLVLLLVAAGFWGSRHTDVYAYNGFQVPVDVTVGDEQRTLGPQSHTTFSNLPAEDGVTFAATIDGAPFEEIEADLSGTAMDAVIYNVGGRGLLELGTVRYGEGEPPDSELLSPGAVLVVDEADYMFVEPPEEKQVRENGTIDNSVLLPVTEDEEFTLATLLMALMEQGQLDHVLTIAAAEARVSDAVDELLPWLANAAAARDADTAKAWIQPLLESRDSIELHRAWQELHETGDEALVASYRARLADDPSPANHYLLARILDGREDETHALLEKAVDLDPEYGRAWGALGWNRGVRGDYAGSLEAYQRQAAVDPDAADAVDERLRVARLAGLDEQRLMDISMGGDDEMTWASSHLLAAQQPARVTGLVDELRAAEFPPLFLASVLLSAGRVDGARAAMSEAELSAFDPTSSMMLVRLAMSDGATDDDRANALGWLGQVDPAMVPDYVLLYGVALAREAGDDELAARLEGGLGTSELRRGLPLLADPSTVGDDLLPAEGVRTRALVAVALAHRAGPANGAKWRALARRMALPDELPAWTS